MSDYLSNEIRIISRELDKYKKLCVTLEIEHNRRFPSNKINRLRGDYPFYLLFSLLDNKGWDDNGDSFTNRSGESSCGKP